MSAKDLETKKAAAVKALLGLIGAMLLYFLVFANTDMINSLLQSKSYRAPLTSMTIVLAASFLYGMAVAKILRHTLETKLKSQQLREE
ncbi:hypothetical protein [Desulfoscipio geothermicus]|uniref:Uncharacterized protein n=1 Tax=Desulfoscipio geothermicus DSM 3669 TaxID=1121426 RepID=A0A1I6DR65_9FIRM|nr:hypothetical protein [Desulfoscipio geothermicus]SFR07925.1 hypothetical protein SAMN05660706_11580 [Desulfoscipio geothermicus DSM 3669]